MSYSREQAGLRAEARKKRFIGAYARTMSVAFLHCHKLKQLPRRVIPRPIRDGELFADCDAGTRVHTARLPQRGVGRARRVQHARHGVRPILAPPCSPQPCHTPAFTPLGSIARLSTEDEQQVTLCKGPAREDATARQRARPHAHPRHAFKANHAISGGDQRRCSHASKLRGRRRCALLRTGRLERLQARFAGVDA